MELMTILLKMRKNLIQDKLEFIDPNTVEVNEKIILKQIHLEFISKTIEENFNNRVKVSKIPNELIKKFSQLKKLSLSTLWSAMTIELNYSYKKIYQPPIQMKKNVGSNISLSLAISQTNIKGFVFRQGTNNGYSFAYFMKKLLEHFKTKSLFKSKEPILIMDNASFHQNLFLINMLIDNKIKILFTTPYTPQNNLIEYLFTDIKNILDLHIFLIGI